MPCHDTSLLSENRRAFESLLWVYDTEPCLCKVGNMYKYVWAKPAGWPGWTDAAELALQHPTVDSRTRDTWLGGVSHVDPEAVSRGWPSSTGSPDSTQDGPIWQSSWFVVAGAAAGAGLILLAVLIEARRRRKARA